MSPNRPKALIVNFPERVGASMQTLLASHLGIQVVEQVRGVQSSLRAFEDYSPELVFLGFHSHNQESVDLLHYLRQRFPGIRCIALLLDPGKRPRPPKRGHIIPWCGVLGSQS